MDSPDVDQPDVSPPEVDRPGRLVLYQRDDCHLCDLALEALAQARVTDFDSVFIDGDAALEARYGERVPVLRRHAGTETASGDELGWPFDAEKLRAFLTSP